jgi:hypothetical protein
VREIDNVLRAVAAIRRDDPAAVAKAVEDADDAV